MRALRDPAKFFWLSNGRGLRSLRELADYLPEMTDEIFSFHVNTEKNDFCNWIRGVFQQHELADKLAVAKTKIQFQTLLYNHIIQSGKPKAPPAAPTTEQPRQKDPAKAKIMADPQAFAKYHEVESKRQDDLADRFDAVARRFVESLHPEEPEALTKRVEQLEERYLDLRRKISETRRSGKDPLLAEFVSRTIPSKIKYARLTNDPRDFQDVEIIFREAEVELEDAIAFVVPNVKEEVDRLAGKRGGET